jgi:predicted dehydrogenase
MAKSLVVGMIGYKFMGRAHSNAWRQADKFFKLKARPVLKTLCGRNPAAVREAADQLGWQQTANDWREVLADPEIDAVDINTANDTHAEIAIAAAKAGKHILCEKPLALTVKQCEAMVAAAKKAGITHMICHNYRRIPALALAKRMIDQGELGELYHYRARYLQDWIVDPKFPLVWRLQGKVAGSGAHGDINAHIIDAARYLVGEFESVSGLLHTFIKERPIVEDSTGLSASGGRKMGRVTVDDAALALGRFRNGALANLEASRFALGHKNGMEIEVNGSKGSVMFNFEDMNRLKFYNNADPAAARGFRDIIVTEGAHPYAGAWWPPGHILGYEHTFVHTIVDFVNACATGKGVSPDFVDGLRNQQVLEAVATSAKSGAWVKLPR